MNVRKVTTNCGDLLEPLKNVVDIPGLSPEQGGAMMLFKATEYAALCKNFT